MIDTWPLLPSVVALVAAGLVLVVVGSRFARLVDRLADATGLGEALAGALLLGASTSLPGLVTTVTGAAGGDADFAVSNAVGGIAAQTAFLVVADLTYRRANLEHAAASAPNILQTLLLVILVGVVLVAGHSPDVTLGGVHPATILLVLTYGYGLVLSRRTQERPMWQPRRTPETREDVPEPEAAGESLGTLWLKFAALALTVGATGFVVARAGLSVAGQTGLSGTIVGGLFTSVITSLPELVTVLAAVRAGALTLAVGDIIGGNTFDVLFVAAADVAYRDGSVYHAMQDPTAFLLGLTVVLTAILGAGLVHREERGIGFEGLAILALYGGGVAVLWSMS